MVAVVDYGMGNLRSVYNAVDLLGYEAKIINAPEELIRYERVILPGVGSFGICIKNLCDTGFDQALKEFVKTGKPLMGICLGMQILAGSGVEGGLFQGLNLIEGEVVHFDVEKYNLNVPHVGWNEFHFKDETHPLVKGIKQNTAFYFTHSYHFKAKKEEAVFGTTEYGGLFISSVIKDNIFATQFHPEKSQESGLKLLKNFLNWKV